MSSIVPDLTGKQVWFFTGSQHLYGEETLRQVADQSQQIARTLAESADIPVTVVWKPVLTDSESHPPGRVGRQRRRRRDRDHRLDAHLQPGQDVDRRADRAAKPLLHLHTQANVELPWDTIDFDFMNLNQAAHGDREFGYIATRLGASTKDRRRPRQQPGGHRLDRHLGPRRGRLGRRPEPEAGPVRRQHALRRRHRGRQDRGRDPVRGAGQHLERQRTRRRGGRGSQQPISTRWSTEYQDRYDVAPELRTGGDRHESLRYGAAIELGLRSFLETGGFGAFTTTFEDLGAAAATSRPRGATADGRRVRLRRRR